MEELKAIALAARDYLAAENMLSVHQEGCDHCPGDNEIYNPCETGELAEEYRFDTEQALRTAIHIAEQKGILND